MHYVYISHSYTTTKLNAMDYGRTHKNLQYQIASQVVVATVKGPARRVLLGERTALNVLTRASGIATQVKTYKWVGYDEMS